MERDVHKQNKTETYDFKIVETYIRDERNNTIRISNIQK